jgi:exosortase C (VPDSG-CTERM-specific)
MALVAGVFQRPVSALVIHSIGSGLHSHILLIPFISAYLIHIRRKQLPKEYVWSPVLTGALFIAGFGLFALARALAGSGHPLSENDSLSLLTLSLITLLTGGGFLFLGRKWMTAAAFPVAFLIFMIPLPDKSVDWLETASKLASAEAAAMFFHLADLPVFREGVVFQLPGMIIEVAQECSGIRSSFVLLITAVLAANLFLHSTWRRLVFVAFTVPLGIVRNGFRILVIAELCVRIGPHMIHSAIHHHGGPVFFALSLIPMGLMLWALRRGDEPGRSGSGGSSGAAEVSTFTGAV